MGTQDSTTARTPVAYRVCGCNISKHTQLFQSLFLPPIGGKAGGRNRVKSDLDDRILTIKSCCLRMSAQSSVHGAASYIQLYPVDKIVLGLTSAFYDQS